MKEEEGAMGEGAIRPSCPECGMVFRGVVPQKCHVCGADLSSLAEETTRRIRQIEKALPERIGRFRIIGRLGAGAFGVVYKAEDTRLKRLVALKVLLQKHLGDNAEEVVKRFIQEAQTAANISHPNVVQVYDSGVDGEFFYYAMELVEGHSLTDDIAANKHGMPAKRAAEIMLEAAKGLAEALTVLKSRTTRTSAGLAPGRWFAPGRIAGMKRRRNGCWRKRRDTKTRRSSAFRRNTFLAVWTMPRSRRRCTTGIGVRTWSTGRARRR